MYLIQLLLDQHWPFKHNDHDKSAIIFWKKMSTQHFYERKSFDLIKFFPIPLATINNNNKKTSKKAWTNPSQKGARHYQGISVYNNKPVHQVQAAAQSSHFLLHNLIRVLQLRSTHHPEDQSPWRSIQLCTICFTWLTSPYPCLSQIPCTTPCPLPSSSTPLPLSIIDSAAHPRKSMEN